MGWILYLLGVIFCFMCFSLGYEQQNLIGGGFWGLVFLAVCCWIGSMIDETEAAVRKAEERFPRR